MKQGISVTNILLRDLLEILPKNLIISNDAFYNPKTDRNGILVNTLYKPEYKTYLDLTVVSIRPIKYTEKTVALRIDFAN